MLRLPLLAACVLLFAPALAGDEPPVEGGDETQVVPSTHVVETTEMVLEIRAESRLEAGETVKVQLLPEAYSGTFEIAAIERRVGRVAAGQPLLQFDAEPLDEQIRNAETTLAEVTERLGFEQQELEMMRQANVTRIERAEHALADAEVAWELWETFHSERMLRAADLGTRQRESGVLNQREELAQLQSMYEGAELESATKEIVLERATRGLAISEEWLDIAREDERVTVDYSHGQRTRDVRNEVRYRAEALEHARLQSAIAETRKERTIRQVKRSHEDAVKRLEQLNADRQLFVVEAPRGGLLARIEREPGDRINARQVVAEIHDDASLRLTFNATPNDLRVLREGDSLMVRVPELPEVVMTGQVEQIEPIGRASGKQTHFNVQVRVETPHELARIGLNAQVELVASLGQHLTVPKKAVTWEDGRAFVEVLAEEERVRTEITLGASNKDVYQVISGLDAGDAVVMPEKE